MSVIPVRDNRLLARRASEDARQYVYRVIRHCILEFFLAPGQKMNEIALAESLDVSRTPVHDTFFKLSRENMVDIFPKRGAFVSKISCQRIENAIWSHTQLGTSMLHSIYIKEVSRSRLESLYYPLHQLDDLLGHGDLTPASRLLTEYYKNLYRLAGDMDLVWDSLQKTDVDLRRLIYLATSSPTVVEAFIYELTSLTDALVARDSDRACRIYASHLSRMRLLLPPLKQHNPEYFVD